MRPFKKGNIRGYREPAHCAFGIPHHWDHSSPPADQSYKESKRSLFSASVGIAYFYHKTVSLPSAGGLPPTGIRPTIETRPWWCPPWPRAPRPPPCSSLSAPLV